MGRPLVWQPSLEAGEVLPRLEHRALPPVTCKVGRLSVRAGSGARFVSICFWGPGPKNGVKRGLAPRNAGASNVLFQCFEAVRQSADEGAGPAVDAEALRHRVLVEDEHRYRPDGLHAGGARFVQ